MLSRVHFTYVQDGTPDSALFRSRTQAIAFVSRINREGWGLRFVRREDDATKRSGEVLHRYGDTAVHRIHENRNPEPLYRESRGTYHSPFGTTYGRPTI